jgi:hypothetical protein
MRSSFASTFVRWLSSYALAVAIIGCPDRAAGGGVTIITHGLNGNVDEWVTGMATNIANYARFPGTNFSCYEMAFSNSGGSYFLTAARVAGTEPVDPASGEIVVKLDWRQLADGNSYNTYQVASAVVPALLNTNFITELGGHALVEFPLHLIGHSRGGSLVCEISRQLGTNGVWVDQATTLDPHPLNDPAFPLDIFVGNAVDAPARTYENVLFHDNYWQNAAFGLTGLSVVGSYTRRLTTFSGGYSGLTGSHSDVHLWYHGTVDWRVPTSDTEASLTSTERSSWWVDYEDSGNNAGFNYSLLGGADRTSLDRPVGLGFSAIRDGYNQNWELGAGVSDNRTPLPSNNGGWPNVIRLNRTTTNAVEQGQAAPIALYYQWAQPASSLAIISLYIDDDFNPLNTNQTLLAELVVPGNGAGFVSLVTTNITLSASKAPTGTHSFFARITGGARMRFLYAPELVQVIAPPQPPILDITRLNDAQFRIVVNGSPGQTVMLQTSADFSAWLPLATNTLTGSQWILTNTPPPALTSQLYRAFLPQVAN